MTETHRRADPEILGDWTTRLFSAAGCPPEEAALIAEHLVDSNLSGHPSHGLVRVPRYVAWLRAGRVRARAKLSELVRTPAFALLDGHFSFGQVLGHRFVALAAAMAAESGVAVIGLRHSGHLGRVGAWSERLVARGLVSVLFVNVAGSRLVAPFGAKTAAMSTAPVAIGIPHDAGNGDPFILDFATSRVAEGKVLVALSAGGTLPDDALIDAEGRDSADPRALYGDSAGSASPNPQTGLGALQPMGLHKGSGLALACELLAGALTGSGTNADSAQPFCNGLLGVVLDPARFGDTDIIRQDIESYIAFVRRAAPRDPRQPVLIPGDPERARRRQAERDGLLLEARLCDALEAVSRSLDVPVPSGLLG